MIDDVGGGLDDAFIMAYELHCAADVPPPPLVAVAAGVGLAAIIVGVMVAVGAVVGVVVAVLVGVALAPPVGPELGPLVGVVLAPPVGVELAVLVGVVLAPLVGDELVITATVVAVELAAGVGKLGAGEYVTLGAPPPPLQLASATAPTAAAKGTPFRRKRMTGTSTDGSIQS